MWQLRQAFCNSALVCCPPSPLLLAMELAVWQNYSKIAAALLPCAMVAQDPGNGIAICIIY